MVRFFKRFDSRVLICLLLGLETVDVSLAVTGKPELLNESSARVFRGQAFETTFLPVGLEAFHWNSAFNSDGDFWVHVASDNGQGSVGRRVYKLSGGANYSDRSAAYIVRDQDVILAAAFFNVYDLQAQISTSNRVQIHSLFFYNNSDSIEALQSILAQILVTEGHDKKVELSLTSSYLSEPAFSPEVVKDRGRSLLQQVTAGVLRGAFGNLAGGPSRTYLGPGYHDPMAVPFNNCAETLISRTWDLIELSWYRLTTPSLREAERQRKRYETPQSAIKPKRKIY